MHPSRLAHGVVLILTLALLCGSGPAAMARAPRVGTAADDTPDGTNPEGEYGYAGASGSDEVAILDLQATAMVDRLSLLPEGDYPYDATMKPDGTEVWIAGANGNGIVVIDTATNQISQRFPVGEYPVSVAFRKDGMYAFVTTRNTKDVTVVEAGTYASVDTIAIPTYYLGPGNLAPNPENDALYVVDWYSDHFFVLSSETFTVTEEVQLGARLWQLVVNPLGHELYITDREQDLVHVVDAATLGETKTIPVGDDPWGIDISPDGKIIYVTNEDSHNVTAINAVNHTVITTIALPHGDAKPRDVDFSIDGCYAYVTSGSIADDDQVYVLDAKTHTPLSGINVAPASNPNVVAVAPQMIGARPDAPILYAIENGDWNPMFLVDWSDATGAITYTLQEGANPDFTAAVERYQGAASQYQVVNQPGGRWYYRVKASNVGGDSPWSNAESVDVDVTPPSSTASSPAFTNLASISVNWNASDESPSSGLKQTCLWYKFTTTGLWTEIASCQQSTSGTFPFNLIFGEGTYYFQTIAQDQAGNVEAGPAGDGDTQTIVQPQEQWWVYLPLIMHNVFVDPYEPNGSFAQAWGPLVSGQTYRAYFPTEADEDDYYYFDLPAAHSVEIWLTDILPGNDHALYLYDAAHALVDFSDEYDNADEHIFQASLLAGRYYVRVERFQGTTRTQPYALRLAFTD